MDVDYITRADHYAQNSWPEFFLHRFQRWRLWWILRFHAVPVVSCIVLFWTVPGLFQLVVRCQLIIVKILNAVLSVPLQKKVLNYAGGRPTELGIDHPLAPFLPNLPDTYRLSTHVHTHTHTLITNSPVHKQLTLTLFKVVAG